MAQNACINKLHVIPRPITFWGCQGEKHPIFDVFEGFSPITLVFLNQFTSKRSQNACINKLHVIPRHIIFLGGQGAVRKRKTPIFIFFKWQKVMGDVGFEPTTSEWNET